MDKQREELFASLSGDESLEQLIEMGILRISKGKGYVFELEPDDEDECASLVYVPEDDIHLSNTGDALLYVSGDNFESTVGRFHTEAEVAAFAKIMSGFASRDFEDC